MKKSCLLLASCLSFLFLSAQNKNTWSWEGGDISSYPAGIYGTKGVAHFANHPGERAEAVSWKNASGELWLFGGHRYFPNGLSPAQNLNDLWKYNVTTNLWTWVSGDIPPTSQVFTEQRAFPLFQTNREPGSLPSHGPELTVTYGFTVDIIRII